MENTWYTLENNQMCPNTSFDDLDKTLNSVFTNCYETRISDNYTQKCFICDVLGFFILTLSYYLGVEIKNVIKKINICKAK